MTTVDAEGRQLLHSGPFRVWLDQRIADAGSIAAVAADLGMSDRTLRQACSNKLVSLDTVDRAVAGSKDTFLWDLYPSLYEFEGAA